MRENEELRMQIEGLKSLSSENYQQINNDLTKYKCNCKDLSSQLITAKADRNKLEEENQKLKKKVTSLQTSFESLTSENRKLKDNLQSVQYEDTEMLRKQLSESRRNNDHLVSQLKSLKSSQNDIDEVNTSLLISNKQINTLEQKNKDLSQDLNKARSEILKLKASNEVLENRITNLSNENQNLKERNLNSLMLQIEKEQLKDSSSDSNQLEENKYKVNLNSDDDDDYIGITDNDDLSIGELGSEDLIDDKSLQKVIQSIINLNRTVKSLPNRDVQTKLSELTKKAEILARGALKKPKL